GDFLADAAGPFLAHVLDHLPLPRDHLQRLGHVLAELGQLIRATAWTGAGRGDDEALARQMRRQWAAPWLAARVGFAGPSRRTFSGDLVFGKVGLQISQLESQLLDEMGAALRGLAEALAPQLGDGKLLMRDHGCGAGGRRFSGNARGAFFSELCSARDEARF